LRRQDSVRNAFEAADRASEIIVIHDAARPFASERLVTKTIAAASEAGAAVAAVPSRDTVKRVEAAHVGRVAETLPRELIYLAQTPQAFRREVLQAALVLGETEEATDEATLAERAGLSVTLVEGEHTNIKITTPADLPVAEAIAGMPPSGQAARAGTGYDLHRLVPGRPLVIGGVLIPSELGALGHSDADVACHAITDAILGAAGAGDIGRMFPDSDPQWKDASSRDLLARAVARVAEDGYEVANVDVTIILERPKIRDHIGAMCIAMAKTMGIDPSCVSVKGKTNEGVDAVGRGEAVAAHAIAVVRSCSRSQ
jgi:2-C-methyl-D-erythritol 4-phosphate cytidylyltransferase/2-C-methyl-D-erythritol 2,4-cyclodiphosphate synthase